MSPSRADRWLPAILFLGALAYLLPLRAHGLSMNDDGWWLQAVLRMRAGEVAACLCASERPVAGARSVLLGAMRYRALASPAFIARHFPHGVRADQLARTPALVFGPDAWWQQSSEPKDMFAAISER